MRIFISHSKKDNPVLYRILTILDEYGIPKWVDDEQIDEISSEINEKINDGLASCDHFLLIWSTNAQDSTYVKKEYNAAISHDYDSKLEKIIIRLDDTPLPPLLSDKKFHSVSEENLDVVLRDIFEKVKANDVDQQNSEQFNEYLDESFGKVKIGGHEYSTSHALSRVDPDMYREDMQGWLSNKDDGDNTDES